MTFRQVGMLLIAAGLFSPTACSCNQSGGAGTNAAGSGAGGTSGVSGSGSTSGGPMGTLTLSPPSQTLVLNGSTPQTASFTVQFQAPGGQPMDVMADSVAFDRPDLASVANGEPVTVTAPSMTGLLTGGTGHLHAVYQGVSATATLTVQVQVVDYGDAGLTSTSPPVVALSGDGGLPNDPSVQALLYPYDQTVWPLGLTSPLLMWSAPQAGDVYRLHYSEKDYTFDGYYPLASVPAQMRLAQANWDRITASNDTSTSADPLTFTLSRWDSHSMTAYQSATETWTIAPASLQGAIYYWTLDAPSASNENGHITMFQPGTGAQPQVLNNGTCAGCHSVNAQGTVMVADVDDTTLAPSAGPYGNWSSTRAWASFDLTNAQDAGAPLLMQTNKFGADLALTPDGKYLVFGGPTPVDTGGSSIGSPPVPGSKYMSLGEVATGKVVAQSGLDSVPVKPGMSLYMPAFSPDGTKLAVIASQLDSDNVIPNSASSGGTDEYLGTIAFDEAGPTFSPALDKVVDGNDPVFSDGKSGLAYPSFTPDSQSIAFHVGTYTTGCFPSSTCDNNTPDDGNLYLVAASGGTPVELTAANTPPDPNDANASVEPTFNPQARGGYSWVVFTSMRAWGNQSWPTNFNVPAPGQGHVNGQRRLWAAAIDPKLGTVDPSHPAFYLEGQEDRPNMRGFWTLAPCLASGGFEGGEVDAGAACVQGFQCCSGFCVNGQCANIGQVSCAGIGASCSQTSDCCNSPTVTCSAQGVCQQPFE